MKFLFHQNLSTHLVEHRRDAVPASVHVGLVGLGASTDSEVWEYDRDHGHMIVSKDSDFRQLAFLYGTPPKVAWLRVENASTITIVEVLLDHLEAIEHFAVTEDEALLVIPMAAD